MTQIAFLAHRGVVEITGPDRVTFLNGLTSNDVAKASPETTVWAALLTPQGRYLFDFFVFADETRLLLDLTRQDIPALIEKLRRFRLRADVQITESSENFRVYAVWQGMPPKAPLTAADPRLPEAGYRCLLLENIACSAAVQDYAAHRIRLGLPDSAPDLEAGKTLLLEAGFDELHGIDWKKGCYMGQELTARTKYRGLVKRRLIPVTLPQPDLPVGTPILADGQEVGSLRSSAGGHALAMLQVSALKQPLFIEGQPLEVHKPDWVHHPA